MNTIKSISYMVREWNSDFCIIESMTLSDGKNYQRGIQYALPQVDAQNIADSFQAQFDGWGYRPVAKKANPFNYNAPYNPEFLGAQPARAGEDY
jgi:hypothetical protein